jgi:putative endonuclease
MAFYTYIVASRRNGTLYTGSTDDLAYRVYQHRQKIRPASFAAKHDTGLLVWYEWHETRDAAFRRERQIKKWNRLWKLRMIEEMNPGWHDLLDRSSVA